MIQASLTVRIPAGLTGHELIAPPIFGSEVTSILSEMAYRHELPAAAARQALLTAHGLAVTIVRPDALYEAAWDLAASLGWAKTYDAEYVVLAQSERLPLVTIDERLRRGVAGLVEVLGPADL